mmetsp:Transcript_27980/g.65720  ORF Transcript_27980/g.65720 Transcript_27980/m.65720 type:complete len:230 (-) Transcript_27980:323-1012(-)
MLLPVCLGSYFSCLLFELDLTCTGGQVHLSAELVEVRCREPLRRVNGTTCCAQHLARVGNGEQQLWSSIQDVLRGKSLEAHSDASDCTPHEANRIDFRPLHPWNLVQVTVRCNVIGLAHIRCHCTHCRKLHSLLELHASVCRSGWKSLHGNLTGASRRGKRQGRCCLLLRCFLLAFQLRLQLDLSMHAILDHAQLCSPRRMSILRGLRISGDGSPYHIWVCSESRDHEL